MRLIGARPKRFIVVLLLLLLPVFVVLRHRSLEETGTLRWYDQTLVRLTSPVSRILHAAVSRIRSTVEHYFFLVGVMSENEQLKKENADLQAREILRRELASENGRLNKLLDLRSSLQGEWIAARVISYPPIGPYRLLTVDKGSSEGVRKKAVVICPGGLVGQVVRVFSNTSQVLLVTDPTSAVDGRIENTGSRGLVVGKTVHLGFEHELFLGAFEYLNQAAAIDEGAAVVTSGLDGIYPSGLLIGHVRLGKKRKYDVFQEADVIPAVDAYQLKEVLVLQ